MTPGTRAVIRVIEPGLSDVICDPTTGGCGEDIRFSAQTPFRARRYVIANVYENGKWDRIEYFHLFPCYIAAGMPFGRPPELGDLQLKSMSQLLDMDYEDRWEAYLASPDVWIKRLPGRPKRGKIRVNEDF